MADESATVEVSSESLGLTPSNTLLNFILSQKETNDTAMENTRKSFVWISEMGCEDNASIVVLGKNSLDAIETRSLAEYERIRQKNMAIDCKSMISSLSAAEVERKLTEVLQENSRLKETLEKNNLLTKHILNVIASKQEEVYRVREEHKRQFDETKALVNVLRNDNNEYKMKIQKLSEGSAYRYTQTEARVDESSASVLLNENAGESEVTRLIEKCEKQDQEITWMHTVIASLEQRLESTREAHEELSRIHEEQKREFAATKDLVNVVRTENDEIRMKMDESNRESTNKFMPSCKSTKAEAFVQHWNERVVDDSPQWLQLLIWEEFLELNELYNRKHQTINEPRDVTPEWRRLDGIFADYSSTLLDIERWHVERKGLGEDKNLCDIVRKKENEFLVRIAKLELEKNYLTKIIIS